MSKSHELALVKEQNSVCPQVTCANTMSKSHELALVKEQNSVCPQVTCANTIYLSLNDR